MLTSSTEIELLGSVNLKACTNINVLSDELAKPTYNLEKQQNPHQCILVLKNIFLRRKTILANLPCNTATQINGLETN
ncbi:hypothetical protein TYRP_004362 [Tyrophagus putrescentiae]|nr:hypothetical protein TYRP_004362 [Tyrophagus putrescentiae]